MIVKLFSFKPANAYPMMKGSERGQICENKLIRHYVEFSVNRKLCTYGNVLAAVVQSMQY